MEKNDFLKLLEEAATSREELDNESKISLVESQISVLQRKIKGIKEEKDRIFQAMADSIMTLRNQLEVNLKVENIIKNEIAKLEEEIKRIQKDV